MTTSAKTLEFTIERTIAAPAAEVFDAWLNPKTPGTPWNEADKLILNPKVDGFFYWLIHGIPHYGRFTELQRPARMQHTWVSPNTLGHESTVTVTFKKQGEATLMTLVHSGIPVSDAGKSHDKGWNYFVGNFAGQFGKDTKKSK